MDKISVGVLRQRFQDETGKFPSLDSETYILWLENQIVDPEYKHPNLPSKKDWRYYTDDEISEQYHNLSEEDKREVLWDALDYMQQYNGRSRFMCKALAMGYENYEGERHTYFKRGQQPE